MSKKLTKTSRILKLNWRRNIPPKLKLLMITKMGTKRTFRTLGQWTPTTLLCFSNNRYNGSSSKTCKRFRLRAGLLSLSCKKLRLQNRNHPEREKSRLKSNDGWQSWCLLNRRLRRCARTSPSQSSRHQHPNRNQWHSRILKWDLVTHYNSRLKSKTLRHC
jgi:hypothetical protein